MNSPQHLSNDNPTSQQIVKMCHTIVLCTEARLGEVSAENEVLVVAASDEVFDQALASIGNNLKAIR